MSSTRKLPKDYKPLLKAARKAGCEVIERKNGYLIRAQGGGTSILHSTPRATGHAFENAKADLRRIGVDV